MEEIVIPDLDDDDDDVYTAPSFGKHGFGSGSNTSLPDTAALPYAHRSHQAGPWTHHPKLSSSSSYRPNQAQPSPRGHHAVPSSSTSYSRGNDSFDRQDRPRLAKFSNGSQASIALPQPPFGGSANVPVPRKGSLASLKNAFKASAAPGSVPPVPLVDAQGGYPALRNPFSRTVSATPASPAKPFFPSSQSPKTQARNVSSPSTSYHAERKQSFASQRSMGGRSATSNGSSNFRADDYPMPSFPAIPSRNTPSRTSRRGSDTTSVFGASGRRNGSLGMEEILEGRSPAEEALRVVFTRFKEVADEKVSRMCSRPLTTQPSLVGHFQKDLDPTLDDAVSTLANCGQRHARRVYDLLQGWSDGHCRGIGAAEVRSHLDRSLGLQMRVEDAAAILSARKTAAARYICVRAVTELVQAAQGQGLGDELGLMIEGHTFNSYRSEKLEEDGQTVFRRAISQLQVELLGELSRTRFLTITHRFISEITKYASSAPTKETEARIEHLLRGMRSLNLRVYPESELELTAEFIESLSGLFANAHGQQLKLAYVDTLRHLLHPVVESATAEVNHPMFFKAIAVILQRANVMAAKARYWAAAFPLVVVTLGVSPRDVFMQQWQTGMDGVTARLKDKTTRTVAMNSFIRLLWIYLNRCSESATSMRKRIDGVLRVFFSANGPLYPADLPPDPFILMLHFAITRQLDQGEDLLAEFLSGLDLSASLDHILVDRLVMLVRGLTLSLTATAEERSAVWPKSADFSMFTLDGYEADGDGLPADVLSRSGVPELLAKSGPALTAILLGCDRAVGNLLLSSDAVAISTHTSSLSIDNTETFSHKHGDVQVTYPYRYNPQLRLLASVLDAAPRCFDTVDIVSIGPAICRASFSADAQVSAAASAAMIRLAADPTHCAHLVNTYREFVFETRHVFRDTFIGSRSLEAQFERVVSLWLALVRLHLDHLRNVSSDESQSDVSVIKIEGCGLFLLCSSSLALRKVGVQILMAARELDGAAPAPSAPFRYSRLMPTLSATSRAIQLLEHTFSEPELAALRNLPGLTTADRHRLDALTSAGRDKLMLRIAETDGSKSPSLWMTVLPFCIGRLLAELPDSAAELRISVITAVLRLQGYVALIASQNLASGGLAYKQAPGVRGAVAPRTASDMTALADQWRAYMTVMVVTAPSIPSATSPPMQRTKDAIILTPDTIGTTALFYYLATLLAWEDPRFRDAAVHALGATGQAHLGRLVDILLATARRLADGAKSGQMVQHTRRGAPRTAQNPLWTTIAHVFRLVSPLLLDARSANYSHNLSATLAFVKIVLSLLSDPAVKEDYDLQSLRRSFCMVIETLTDALAKLDSSERFLGEETRGALFRLCSEWSMLGQRADVVKARENQILQAAAGSYRGERDRAAYLDDLQAKTKLLSVAAAEAMAGLCQGKLVSNDSPGSVDPVSMVDPFTVLRWIRGIFTSSSSSYHPTGRKALYALLRYNWECDRLLDEVLHQSFGEGEQFTLNASFFGTVVDLVDEGVIALPLEQISCLALSKLGHPAADVRLRAFRVCVSLLSGEALSPARSLYPAIGSGSTSIYLQAQKEMSGLLADVFLDNSVAFIAECTTRLSQLEGPRRSATLRIMPAWVSDLELADGDHQQALFNLVYLAVRFFDDHLPEVRDIFEAFAGGSRSSNTTALVKFLFEQGGRRRSPEFVASAMKIVASLACSPAAENIFDDVCDFIEPAAMAATPEGESEPRPATSLVDLDHLLASSGPSQTFSTGHLAFLFAGELLPYRAGDAELGKRLPMLLHVGLVLADCPAGAVRDSAQSVLLQVLRSWICEEAQASGTEEWSAAEAKINALAAIPAEKLFWRTEDDGGDDSAFYAPAQMTTLVMKILGMLVPIRPSVKQEWAELALQWATSCPIRHIACRSFQVYRMLSPRITPRMVSDILARLSSTIADPSPDIQTFNIEILRTFAGMAEALSHEEMLDYPQIFWCAIACMTTPHEHEFAQVVELFSHVLDKTNLSDPDVVQRIVHAQPEDWVGAPPHIQSLLLVGLRSVKTFMPTFDLIRRLASATEDELNDGPGERLLHGFLAALPWMLHSLDLGETNEDLSTFALDLAAMADAADNSGFSRLMTSFAHSRFRTKDDFVKQAGSYLRDWLPTHALDILTVLLGFTLNPTDWLREKAMLVLKLVLTSPESREPFTTHGPELLQPLLRLVSTKHSAQALELLDMPTTSAASSDGQPASLMATGELFGPVLESGWSAPLAQDARDITRANVAAVFDTCEGETRAASRHFSVLQFADMQGFDDFSRVEFDMPPIETDDTRQGSAEALGMTAENASMGDLVGALHSLGQFFDDQNDDVNSPAAFNRTHARLPSDTPSERRVRAVLGRGRNPSISSPIYEHPYQNGLSRHQHTRSNLTESSITSADIEAAGDAGPEYQIEIPNHAASSDLSLTQPSSGFDGPGHRGWRGGSGSSLDMLRQPPSARQGPFRGAARDHGAQPSLSSMSGMSDFDRSENLFGLEEAGDESMTSTVTSLPA